MVAWTLCLFSTTPRLSEAMKSVGMILRILDRVFCYLLLWVEFSVLRLFGVFVMAMCHCGRQALTRDEKTPIFRDYQNKAPKV